MTAPTVTSVRITPVAVQDPPLLNSIGVHQPYALRAIIEVGTDAGLVGLSETYGDDTTLHRLGQVVPSLAGLSIMDTNGLAARVATALGDLPPDTPTILAGPASAAKAVAPVLSAFEVALLDLQGKATGLRVCDLLGGAVRDAVPYSGYLFYRWAQHPADPGYPPDDWGAALDPAGIVAQARRLVDRYGFGSLKLKGGVFPPEEEIAAIRALREAFPQHPLRLDPNANWSVPTSMRVADALRDDLEYLEDPTDGIPGMSDVAIATSLPLATNMCVTSFPELPEAIERNAVQVVLADHHFWGGLRASQRLAGVCQTFGLGLSMHSNSHLGISLAAMTHLAAATPNLSYACDTHTPWQREDLIEPGVLSIRDGVLPVPDGPGLGVRLDREAMDRLHQQYLRCGIRNRDDVAAMRVAVPDWTGKTPRW
ncbi:MAG: glucarate dehydratase [Micromonosporaceae bacterium]|nr:glucarate dehydratase [Micromonosporaceae bacterium]